MEYGAQKDIPENVVNQGQTAICFSYSSVLSHSFVIQAHLLHHWEQKEHQKELKHVKFSYRSIIRLNFDQSYHYFLRKVYTPR